jgi:hypothetical protein
MPTFLSQKKGGDMMTNNRIPAAAFGVLLVAWDLVNIADGFFVSSMSLMLWTAVTVTLLILIFTPAVMFKARWTALGTVIAGVIRIITATMGLTMLPMSLLYGPVVTIVLALPFTYFSFRAYQEK